MGFGVTLTSVTLVSGTTYTFAGDHFSENRFDGNVWVSIDGGTTKIYPDTYGAWGYDEITATFPELLAGTYAAGVVSGSDDPSDTLSDAFTVASEGYEVLVGQVNTLPAGHTTTFLSYAPADVNGNCTDLTEFVSDTPGTKWQLSLSADVEYSYTKWTDCEVV